MFLNKKGKRSLNTLENSNLNSRFGLNLDVFGQVQSESERDEIVTAGGEVAVPKDLQFNWTTVLVPVYKRRGRIDVLMLFWLCINVTR